MLLNQNNLHDYQRQGVDHIIDNFYCGLFLDMGLGKTVTTLTAVAQLIDQIEIEKVLVIAPKKVTQVTWTDEANKWEHLKNLRISVIDGNVKQRQAALHAEADVYACSRDNVVWLVNECGGTKLPFDMLVIDELSSFKNPKSQRFKALRKVRKHFYRVVGLTGTPAPNGLIDLWSQLFLLDEGQRLGKTLTGYRDRYFSPGRRNGDIVYTYDLKKPTDETAQAISDKISDICLSMTAEDYLKMPDKIVLYDRVQLPTAKLKQYQEFEREQVLDLMFDEDGTEKTISASSAAALSNKLCQYANGAIYDENRNVTELHDEKIEKLKEIIEAANGHPVLVAYSFQHDRDRIMKALKGYGAEVLKDEKQLRKWNDGDIPVLITHPASAGHGLNLQKGGNIIVWFGNTWSLELYQQFNARLYRQGQDKPVYIHHIMTDGTVDDKIVKSLDGKNETQAGLMDCIKQLMLKYGK